MSARLGGSNILNLNVILRMLIRCLDVNLDVIEANSNELYGFAFFFNKQKLVGLRLHFVVGLSR